MKATLFIFAVLLAAWARAADIEPVVYETTGGAQVYVACYWASQFPRFEGSDKHLLIACRVSTWHNANPAKRNAILTAIRKWLAGEVEVSAAKLQDLRDALADANIGVALTDDPQAQLTAWGIRL